MKAQNLGKRGRSRQRQYSEPDREAPGGSHRSPGQGWVRPPGTPASPCWLEAHPEPEPWIQGKEPGACSQVLLLRPWAQLHLRNQARIYTSPGLGVGEPAQAPAGHRGRGPSEHSQDSLKQREGQLAAACLRPSPQEVPVIVSEVLTVRHSEWVPRGE